MNLKIDGYIDSFIILKKSCLEAGYIVRHLRYHEQCARMLKDFIKSTLTLKENTIEEKDEDSANTLLSIENFCLALRSEMFMWIELKKGESNEAWNHLIEAQNWVKASTQAKYLERLHQEEYIEKLHQIENVVFPPQQFTSLSMLVKDVKCSICNEKYGKCKHIAGKAYMGQLCSELVIKFEIQHTAFVSYPFDKKSRFPEMLRDGKWVDYMTWKERRCPHPTDSFEVGRPSVERKQD
jgi:hypothetical protein